MLRMKRWVYSACLQGFFLAMTSHSSVYRPFIPPLQVMRVSWGPICCKVWASRPRSQLPRCTPARAWHTCPTRREHTGRLEVQKKDMDPMMLMMRAPMASIIGVLDGQFLRFGAPLYYPVKSTFFSAPAQDRPWVQFSDGTCS